MRRPERIPRALSAAMLASSLSAFVLTGFFGAEMGLLPVFAVMLLCAVFTAAIELITLPNAVLLGGTALGLCSGTALLLAPIGENSLYSILINGDEIPILRALPTVLLLCCAVCLAVCAVNRIFIARCIIAGGLLIMLFIFIWLRITLLTLPAVLITAYILSVLCQICAFASSAKTETPQKMWFVAFSLITAAIVFALPYPSTRIQWEKVIPVRETEQLEQLGEKLDIEQVSDDSLLSETGFSADQSNLGGWVELKSDICLSVSFSDAPHADRFAGGIYDSYNGKGWLCTADIDGFGYTAASPSDLPCISDSDLYGSARISFVGTASDSDAPETLFYPPYSVILSSECGGYSRSGAQMLFEGGPRESYTVHYFRQPCGYELTDSERDYYLALPDTLPERVRELAAETVDGCTDDAAAAEEILRLLSGYKYKYLASKPPEGQDFVDYFLFDAKSGYCVYFASSMAVLARCAGIPARYVQGYSAGSSNKLITYITQGSAHAWAELYIDGKWVVYDPITSPADTSAQEAEEARNASLLKRILLYSYAAAAGAAVIFIILKPIFSRLAWRIRLRKKRGKTDGYRTALHCGRLLWVLSACGKGREPSETLTEFGERICRECDWLDPHLGRDIRRLLDAMSGILYSPSAWVPDALKKTDKNSPTAPTPNFAKTAAAVRRAFIRRFGLIKYLRGYRKASL